MLNKKKKINKKTSKSWQTLSFTRQTRVKLPHTVTYVCNMADLFSVVALMYKIVKQKKRREETESGGEMERSGRNQFVRWFLLFLLFVFSVPVGYR